MTTKRLPGRQRAVARTMGLAVTLLAVVSAGAAVWGRGDDGPTSLKKRAINARIGDLAWIQGHWATTFGSDELHEIWSAPGGDCMMASFRWIKDGKVWLYELLTMAEEGGTIVFRFKHFSRALHGWEEKDEALMLVLVKLDENLAVFESPDGGKPKRMVFHRESETRLTVRVDGAKGDDGGELVVKYEKADGPA